MLSTQSLEELEQAYHDILNDDWEVETNVIQLLKLWGLQDMARFFYFIIKWGENESSIGRIGSYKPDIASY